MNQSKIFMRFREPIKNDLQIQQTKTLSNKLNDKIKDFMELKAIKFLNYHNKNLTIDMVNSQVYTLKFLPRYLYMIEKMIIYTRTNVNHPYLLYVNRDDDILTFLIPVGREKKQADLYDYIEAISRCTIPELAAIHIIIEKTIYIRKIGILTSDRFKLIKCENITNCNKKMLEIEKQGIPESQTRDLKKQFNDYYLEKAIELLKKYFEILDNKNYDEAALFLKGGDKITTSKYFHKERLNTFFKNNKTIVGHLEIFIAMYRLFHEVRMKLLKY